MQLYLRVMKSRKVVSPRFGAPADTADVSAVGLASLTAEYETRTGASRTLHERLTRSLAGGETRAVTFYEPYPVAVVEASGARFTDADGNEYLDLNNNMASLIHGHAYPPVMKALREAGSVLGTVQAGAHAPLLELAELLVARFPGFERVRFTNSGSEAAILALRIARRATGRRQVVLFEGGYHGMGSEFAEPDPAIFRVPFNNLDAAEKVLDDSVAAVVAESFLGHAGVIPAQQGFHEELRVLSHRVGAIFVLDEVQSMRNAVDGYHGAAGLRPDLILMGKSLAGGLPAGLVGGRRDLLALASVETPNGLRHSGTFNGNIFSCVAGLRSMSDLDAAQITQLNDRAARLAASLEASGRQLELPVTVTRSGSTMCLHFTETAPTDAESVVAAAPLGRWVHLAALLEGVAIIRDGRMNLSTAVSDGDLEHAASALTRALGRVRDMVRLA